LLCHSNFWSSQISEIRHQIFDIFVISEVLEGCKYTLFLRCGKFTVGDGAKFDNAVHLMRNLIQFFEDGGTEYMELTIPASKTDPFHGGVMIAIAAVLNSPSKCPVCAMKHLFTIHLLPPTSPLFAKADSSPLHRAVYNVLRTKPKQPTYHLNTT
jgi:hypothetical protein